MAKKLNATKIHDTKADRVMNIILGTILVLWCIITAYPLLFVISASLSSTDALMSGKVVLWPVEFSLHAYKFVLNYRDVWIGYRNSLFYVAVDWVFQTYCTLCIAYPISRRYFQGKAFTTWFLYGIGFFSAGMIPIYIQKCNMGLYNNIWAVLIGGIISMTNSLMLRAAIKSNIPEDLMDAARIDGANHYYVMLKIVVPLTKATISVLTLYTMVGCWNEYFNAMMYLRDPNLFPLQLVLRPIMTAAATMNNLAANGASQSLYALQADQGLEGVRYALIIISSVPAIVAYFVVQKAFKGGVMLGAVKG